MRRFIDPWRARSRSLLASIRRAGSPTRRRCAARRSGRLKRAFGRLYPPRRQRKTIQFLLFLRCWIVLLPVVCAAAVIYIDKSNYDAIVRCKPSSTGADPPCQEVTVHLPGAAEALRVAPPLMRNQEFAARYQVLASCLLHRVVCIGALIAIAYLLYTSLCNCHRWFWLPMIVGLFLFVVALANDFSQGGRYTMTDLLESTVQRIGRFDDPAALASKVGSWSTAVAVLCALTLGTTLLPLYGSADSRARRLARQLTNQQRVLYVSTLVMIVSLISHEFLMRWALTFVDPTNIPGQKPAGADLLLYKSIEGLTRSIIVQRGVFYTAVIAATYLPAAALLRYRALALAARARDSDGRPIDDRGAWLDQFGLTTSFIDLAPRIVALLGPLLTGSVLDLLSALAK